MNKLHLIHSKEHAGWIFDTSQPTQGRRYINAQQKLLFLARKKGRKYMDIDRLGAGHPMIYVKHYLTE
jgi:hypothetical protein